MPQEGRNSPWASVGTAISNAQSTWITSMAVFRKGHQGSEISGRKTQSPLEVKHHDQLKCWIRTERNNEWLVKLWNQCMGCMSRCRHRKCHVLNPLSSCATNIFTYLTQFSFLLPLLYSTAVDIWYSSEYFRDFLYQDRIVTGLPKPELELITVMRHWHGGKSGYVCFGGKNGLFVFELGIVSCLVWWPWLLGSLLTFESWRVAEGVWWCQEGEECLPWTCVAPLPSFHTFPILWSCLILCVPSFYGGNQESFSLWLPGKCRHK